MSSKKRIAEIKEAPLSWREMDMLTASEKYLKDAMELPLIEFVFPCFPELDTLVSKKIAQVWRFTNAAFHLQQDTKVSKDSYSQLFKKEAALIYQQEAQRILGSLFPLESEFWTVFYSRQDIIEDKLLIPLDAIHFSTACQEKINYQLIQQALKSIIKGHYAKKENKKYYKNALRLIIELPLPEFQKNLKTLIFKNY